MKKLLALAAIAAASSALALDHPGAASVSGSGFLLIEKGRPSVSVKVDPSCAKGVARAAKDLEEDFMRVTGSWPEGKKKLVVKVDPKKLGGGWEKYEIEVGADSITVTGSDRRGAIYGIYEISEWLGVSPWVWWADAPVERKPRLAVKRGKYVNGGPAVKYRGIFLNDEAPCLTGWVKKTYGTNHGDHRFYEKVGELILRLRGNFLWPAMWSWAFYADDPENLRTMDEMGIIMGTSHHEPMARNHQEWARRRKEFGAWNYRTNKEVLDNFFAEGIRRIKGTEDVVTIGMRGDGDEAMDGAGNLELMKSIISSQRAIIERETGKSASEVPQVWALYKEVQEDFENGLRPPDDVTILLCDDNWGNVRMLPKAEERGRKGGWGMYYHVDYVGAPRNSKFLNCTSAISMWEQMSLAYEYGVDRLWVLNVGDLKPMEYPMTLFLDMAWRPEKYTPSTLHSFTEEFTRSLIGEGEAKEAARILDLTSRYACRCTPEMLNKDTYNLASGEWERVAGDYAKLAEDSRALTARLDESARDCYFEVVGFHVEAMANLYAMYFALAKNDAEGVKAAFARHKELCDEYNLKTAGGKWNGMMRQKVIGYKSWNDNFPADTCPKVEGESEAIASLDVKEPRIYSHQRKKSFDRDMGDNWWMRRHEAILKAIADDPVKEYDAVICGDSTTHRWERHGKEAYAAVTNGLKVLNLGFGADTVRNLLWRLRSGELDGYKAKFVQIMIGTNNGVKEPPAETAAQIRECLREIRLRQPEAKILLCPILPRGNPDSVERGKNEGVNRLLKPLADGERIIWTDYSSVFLLPDGRFDPKLTGDNLHPNAEGYAKWAPVMRKALLGEAPAPIEEKRAPKKAAEALAIEAARFTESSAPKGYRWEFLPGLGYGEGAMEVFPRLGKPEGASLVYNVKIPAGTKSFTVKVATRSTLAFARKEGHRYRVRALGEAKEVNFNSNLNEKPENRYSVFYPTVARRVVVKDVSFGHVNRVAGGMVELALEPLDEGIAFEKIEVETEK
ncbi:MAG: glycosyl hydrolase 115 family protein [Kiritimatiellae bacterium]|nr:glycosyl hydrolase 115 family protein [Kiritimatiellia bacterium]